MTNLSDRDHEQLSCYFDDEMAPDERRAFERRLTAEPALAVAHARLSTLHRRIADAYSAKPEAVPGRVAALLGEGSRVTVLPRRRAHRALWPAALAASLVAAVALVLSTGGDRSQITGDDPLLTRALESEPSRAEGWSRLADGRQLRPVLTFPGRGGDWCREFLLREDTRDWRGVACRREGVWEPQIVARESLPAADDSYRPAATAASADVAGFVSRHATDVALGPDAEAALIARDWRAR